MLMKAIGISVTERGLGMPTLFTFRFPWILGSHLLMHVDMCNGHYALVKQRVGSR